MSDTTHISWADRTWSPWTGCTKISPACDGCYAAHLMDTRMGRVEWGEPGGGEGTRDLMSESYWRKPLAWNRHAAKTGERCWVFPSLCDPFDTAVSPQWRRRFVDLMAATPNILWLLLTKRIGNVRRLTDPGRGEEPLPPNHALMATIANQSEADRDMRKLIEAGHATDPRFIGVSGEPMLGHLDLSMWLPEIDWVICGGETDQGTHKARPSHPDWFRSLRDQCAAADAAFHFKQWGEWHPRGQTLADGNVNAMDKGMDPDRWCDEGCMVRVGKRAAGRLLDGIEHNGFPTVQQ